MSVARAIGVRSTYTSLSVSATLVPSATDVSPRSVARAQPVARGSDARETAVGHLEEQRQAAPAEVTEDDLVDELVAHAETGRATGDEWWR